MVRDYLLKQPWNAIESVKGIEIQFSYFLDVARLEARTATWYDTSTPVDNATARGGNRLGTMINGLRDAQLDAFYARLNSLGRRKKNTYVEPGTTFQAEFASPDCVICSADVFTAIGAPDEREPNEVAWKIKRAGFIQWARVGTLPEYGPFEPLELSAQRFYPPPGFWNAFYLWCRPQLNSLIVVNSEPLPSFEIRKGDTDLFSHWSYNSYE